jgi:hypothetical protein
MFHIIEQEMQWRREKGRPEGFGALRAHRPIIAVGAENPLEDQKMLADYFRMYLCLTEVALGLPSDIFFQTEPMDSVVSMPVYVKFHIFIYDLRKVN